jgi:ADP-heptose:LPS heptosyltransferase
VIEHKSSMNQGFDQLYSHVLPDRTLKHEVERGLALLRFLGNHTEHASLELWATEADETYVRNMLLSHHVHTHDRLIAFCPGAASATRQWPVDNFIELGKWLLEDYPVRIVIVGGPTERDLGRHIQESLGEGAVNVVGATSLRELGVLLKTCLLYVGNDSGPMHIAAAARVPVVEISCHPARGIQNHSNSPKRFGPWGVVSKVLQPERAAAPCQGSCTSHDAHCIRLVDVATVREAVTACLLQNHHQAIQPPMRASA